MIFTERGLGWCTSALVVTFIAAILASPTPMIGQRLVGISGRVDGGSGKHAIYVALWDAQTFLKHPVQQIRIEPHATSVFRFAVAPGHWAVSSFEDLNDNGVLDMGHFGPKEPSGFFRPFHGWRKPKFADVESDFERDTPDADIKLK